MPAELLSWTFVLGRPMSTSSSLECVLSNYLIETKMCFRYRFYGLRCYCDRQIPYFFNLDTFRTCDFSSLLTSTGRIHSGHSYRDIVGLTPGKSA